jgi:hypothetical protein
MRRVALAAMCVVLALPAGQAVAAKKHKAPPRLGPVVTASATGPAVSTPGGTSVATAICPGKLRAFGGGYSTQFGADGAIVVTDSYRNTPGSWLVTGTLIGGTGNVTAYAYCRRNAFPVTEFTATVTLPSGSGQSATADATCRSGTVTVGGGFQTTSGPEPAHLSLPEQSFDGPPGPGGAPLTNTWRVVAQNSNTGDQTITAHAYCASGIKRPASRQDLLTGEVSLFGSLTTSSACPAAPRPNQGKKKRKAPPRLLTAGGFYSPFAPGVLPVHTDSRIVGDSFIDTAVNGGSVPGPMTVQSQAICF